MPHLLLALNNEYLGRYENAISENLEAFRLDPDVAILYSNLMEVYTPLNRLAEAKGACHQALDRKLDGPFLHSDMYVIAFFENDSAEMQRQISLACDMPGAEDWLFSLQSDTVAYHGQLANARELSRKAVESALHNDPQGGCWYLAIERGHSGGGVRKCQASPPADEEGLKLATTRDSETLAALVLARAGNAGRALGLADGLQKKFPDNAELNNYLLPSIRAAVQLDRGNPADIKLLEPAGPYDLAYPRPQLQGGSLVYPAYLCGQAYLFLHRGTEAAAEFQKFIEQRAAVVNCPFGALAYFWLGRAHTLEGDAAAASKSYQEFFALWKEADPYIPILRQAQFEFVKLK